MNAAAAVTSSDVELSRRAARVVPGGMYGHQAVRNMSSAYPQFFRAGEGALITDVDGKEYVDLMCSWGPIVLGHRDPFVNEAVRAQMDRGDCLDGPGPVLVDLAETLVDAIRDADWILFGKNGTDATTACLTIARAHTSRSVVLVARGVYHGAAPWCTPVPTGTLASDRSAMDYFDYNDRDDFDRAVDAAGDDLAGVMLTPFRHVEGEDQELVDVDFARHVRSRCDALGALLIVDDVRCGFRLAHGGSWEPIGVRTDLSAWSKAIANGYPLAAVSGCDAVRDAVETVFLTGSFWMNSTPMAAALATIRRLREIDGVALMQRAGARLREGITAQAAASGLGITYTGPDVMPYVTFTGDLDRRRMTCFAEAALAFGVYLHPKHNWFMSCAMDDDVIDRALRGTEAAFATVRRHFGPN
ncbi:aminotransferase class III-fold pyridoxal phosphate-dependent enzyme [Mycolicibacterium sp. 050158]|uniref:aminotransferase class III-fold pyridoxal phosphate-dependent enzyme n=1 Tax=Mycolicibacterium sp. 050158 TaxID=3090602 RepID=UPI00299DA3C6|nr:aminotransferase class III-fold pyridoxal phosphate-dependent enzyme [Mycolicibacterium sp. 050158]MDX1891342.1 aminotransferase class III-fold pyridoxal phosphate-dependent enzyme [Mycolicibacterium sp. 050158]